MGGNQRMANLLRNNYLSFLVLCGLLLFVFRADWLAMYEIWIGNETFSHGLLIIPISFWLIWKQRAALPGLIGQGSIFGLLLFAAGCVGWLLGKLAEANVVAQFGVVTMLVSLFPIAFGLKLSWKLAFPILFLFFMVPAGEFIESKLMIYTADAIVVALNWTGIAVFRENMHLTLPTGKWSVVEACSGLRYLIASIVLACLFCYLYYKTWTKRILFVSVCIALSILANWVRAYTVVLVGHFSDMKYGTGDDHIYYGWVFFGIVMFGIFWIGLKFGDKDYGPWITATTQEVAVRQSNTMNIVLLLLAVSLVFGVLQWLQGSKITEAISSGQFDSQVVQKMRAQGFESIQEGELLVNPRFMNPNALYAGKQGWSESGFSAYFANQKNRSQMISNTNYFIQSGDFKNKVLSTKSVPVKVANDITKINEQTVLKPDQSKVLVYTWYCVRGRCSSSPYAAKAWMAFSMLTGKGDHSTANMFIVPLGDKESVPTERSIKLLENFVDITGSFTEHTAKPK
jgi:exosortase A